MYRAIATTNGYLSPSNPPPATGEGSSGKLPVKRAAEPENIDDWHAEHKFIQTAPISTAFNKVRLGLGEIGGLAQFSATQFFPTPPKERPYPQPFDLNYSRYEKILEAQKKIAEKEGSKDIGWRTVTNDIMVEFRVLRDYEIWSFGALEDACKNGSLSEVEFFENLCKNLTQDMHDVYEEYAQNNERHGKDDAEKRNLEKEVFRLVEEMAGSFLEASFSLDSLAPFIWEGESTSDEGMAE